MLLFANAGSLVEMVWPDYRSSPLHPPLPTFLITFRQNLYQCGVKRNCATFNINPWRIFIKSLNKVVKFEENTNDCEIQSKYKSCNIVEYVSSGDKDMF